MIDKNDFSLLMESKYVKKWIESYNNGQRKPRLALLSKFSDFIDKDPDTIIIEHHKDVSQDNPLDIASIGKNQLNAFYKYLIGEANKFNEKINDKPLSINSARQYVYSKLASYFKRNNVPLFFQKGEIPSENKGVMDKVWRNGDKRITKDDKKECIKRIKDTFKSIRDKAILLCKISSGIDDVDLFNLKYGDYKKGYFEEYNICYIEGYRQKVNIIYQTFFSSEACNMIEIYMRERKQKGEDLNDKSWLFTSNIHNPKVKYKRIDKLAFAKSLREVCITLGLQNITPKSFRRWFNTELKKNRIDFEIVERMMGHKGSISEKYQTIFEDHEEFAQEYAENIECNVLLGNGNKKTMELQTKIDKLAQENKALKYDMDQLKDLVKAIINKQESEIEEKLALLEKSEKGDDNIE